MDQKDIYKQDTEHEREMSSHDLCDMLGGKFKPAENSCRFLEEHQTYDRSVSEPKYGMYYIIQIFIGTALAFFGVFTSVTLVSPYWYLNLIVLIVSCSFFIFADWYREGDIGESLMRLVILLPIYGIIAILITTTAEFGTVMNAKYWTGFLTTDPVVATTSAMFAAALLNVFLIPKTELMQVLK